MKLTRIAPTPSGFLHIGNAFSFVLTWLIARQEGGKILLRIDDLDAERARPEYIDDIFFTLDWLGLDYDLGPSGPDDFAKNFSQQLRIPLYEEALQQLAALPDTLFACALSRSRIKKFSKDGQYPLEGREQGLSLRHPEVAWRVLTPQDSPVSINDMLRGTLKVNLFGEMRDFIIRRKDGVPAYQVASLVDDHLYGVDLLVRGEDLYASTAAQLFLAEKLAYEDFLHARFLHHPLIFEAPDVKMSKSAGSLSLQALREQWHKPLHFYRWFSQIAGLGDPHTETLQDILDQFRLDRIALMNPVFFHSGKKKQ